MRRRTAACRLSSCGFEAGCWGYEFAGQNALHLRQHIHVLGLMDAGVREQNSLHRVAIVAVVGKLASAR